MADYTVRNYSPGDYQGVMRLWEATGLSTPLRGDDAKTIERTLAMGGVLFLLTTTNDTIVGTSWITDDGRRLYLHHFGIHPDFQGQGLAKILLKESLDFAKEKNMQIKLEVHRENEIALSLYRKYGFAYLGDYHVYIIRKIQELNTDF